MAANIFIDSDYQSILSRIEGLTGNNQRRFGKMNLPQMLEHCAIQLKLAMGVLPSTKTEGSLLFRTTLGRWLTLYVIPWPHGLSTPSAMNVLQNQVPAIDLETGKTQLIDLLQKVKGKQVLNPHPFYGELNKHDWGRLIWRHLNHHLVQFGQ